MAFLKKLHHQASALVHLAVKWVNDGLLHSCVKVIKITLVFKVTSDTGYYWNHHELKKLKIETFYPLNILFYRFLCVSIAHVVLPVWGDDWAY